MAVASAFIVVILVVAGGPGDAGDPATEAMTDTAQTALGPDAIVVVRPVDAMPADDAAIELEGKLHADAVVEVTWSGAGHDAAQVRAHVHDDGGTWSTRELPFQLGDAIPERGRTVGFAIASMLPPPPAKPVAPPPKPPPPTPPPPITPPPAPPSPRAPAGARRVALDAETAFALGAGGNAAGVGGALGVRVAIAGPVWAFVDGSVMVGDMEVAQATTSAIRAQGGLAWEVLPRTTIRPLSFTASFGGGFARHSLERRAAGQAPIHGDRWLAAAQARAELAWWIAPHLALTGALGLEATASATRVVIDGDVVETIPAVRLVAGLGFRTIF
jgi:hypothetical protein